MTKKILEYVESRCNYIKGKLHSCKGYSREEKAIRLEELYQIRKQIAFRNDEIEVKKRQLKEANAKLQETLRKRYKCYTCGTCNGKEDYVNMQRHCENAIKTAQKLNGEIDQLKSENDSLKEKNDQLTIIGMDLNQNNEILRKSFFVADKNKDNWREKAEKYFKTLTEIKEIAEEYEDLHGFLDCSGDLILQKISEVENENI